MPINPAQLRNIAEVINTLLKTWEAIAQVASEASDKFQLILPITFFTENQQNFDYVAFKTRDEDGNEIACEIEFEEFFILLERLGILAPLNEEYNDWRVVSEIENEEQLNNDATVYLKQMQAERNKELANAPFLTDKDILSVEFEKSVNVKVMV